MFENPNISSDIINQNNKNSLTYFIETYGCQMNVDD